MTSPPKKPIPCPDCNGKGWIQTTTGALLRKERQSRGLTQSDIAKESGWFTTMVSEVETGKRPMTAASAERYWNALLAAEKRRGKG